jgi:hypothetical protein
MTHSARLLVRPLQAILILLAYGGLLAGLCAIGLGQVIADRKAGLSRAAVASCLAHVAALVLLGYVTLLGHEVEAPLVITVQEAPSVDESEEMILLPVLNAMPTEAEASEPLPMIGGGDEQGLDVETMLASDRFVTVGRGIGRGELEGRGLGEVLGRELAEPLAEPGAPLKATFFGLSAQGQSFVFVMDISGSMQGTRYVRAKAELIQTVERLSYEQSFSLVFFNHQTYPMTAGELIKADGDNFVESRKWIERAVPSGGTDPLEAMRMAFAMEPDAIFLLTDGEFAGHQDIVLMHRNQTKTIPVHTICLVNPAAERILAAVAHHTGGEYRFIR